MVDAHRIHHRLNVFHEVFRGVCQFGPHADHTVGVGHDFRVFFADQMRFHHLRHPGVTACSAVETRMRHNERLGSHLQCTQHSFGAGVRKVHQDPETITLLHDFRSKGSQTAKVSGRGDHVAQRRHKVVAFMKQLKVPYTTPVHLFHSFQAPLDELCSLDSLDDGWMTTVVCGLKVCE